MAEISEMLQQLSGANESFESIAMMMSLPDDQFALIAPGVLDSFLHSISNPSFQLTLAQVANSQGTTVEEILQGVDAVVAEIDKTDVYSAQKKTFLKQFLFGIGNAFMETQGVAKKVLKVPFELCSENAKVPAYAHITDSGADIYAAEDIVIKPGETRLVSTGIKVQLPPGYEFQVRPKSGIALKTKLRIANQPGTVDEAYRGEIGVIIDNIEPPISDITYEFNENGKMVVTSILHGHAAVIEKGQKIAQLVLASVVKADFQCVEHISDNTDRKDGAYGSTGLK